MVKTIYIDDFEYTISDEEEFDDMLGSPIDKVWKIIG